jgi:hypothetical protein
VDCREFEAKLSRTDGKEFASATEVAAVHSLTKQKREEEAMLLPAGKVGSVVVELEVTFEPL